MIGILIIIYKLPLLDNNIIYYLYLTINTINTSVYYNISTYILLVNALLLVSSPLLIFLPYSATYVPHPDSGSILLLILLLCYPARSVGSLGSSSLPPLPLKSIMVSVFISITFIFSFLFYIWYDAYFWGAIFLFILSFHLSFHLYFL